MKKLFIRGRSVSDDSGMGIIEVLVAFMIFAVIFIGVAYSMVATTRLTADSKSRVVASNIAAGQIDRARASNDPFFLFDDAGVQTIDGVTYSWKRSTGWVPASGSSSGCGIGGGSLQYKRVNLTVTWSGKIGQASPVRVDTIVAPTGRINDPSYGTILVRVLRADGTGVPGVPVTITATSGGAAVVAAPTDQDGCSYALKVTAGTYSVKVAKTNYITDAQQLNPVQTGIVVTAGSTLNAPFQYDDAATYNLAHGYNLPADRRLPTDLDVSFSSTYGPYVVSGATPSAVKLHPITGGYSSVSGKYAKPVVNSSGAVTSPGCISPDPAAWPAGTSNGVAVQAGVRLPPVAAGPGEPETMPIPMGLIGAPYSGTTVFVAKSVAPIVGSGDPGCGVAMTYNFASIGGSGTAKLALPYGSWVLYKKSGSTLVPVAGLIGSLLGPENSGTFTLDPRVP
jgi:type II secretory pathway pseudopilin PulG